MRKNITKGILICLCLLTVLLFAGCESREDRQLRKEYSQKAEMIFNEYFEKNYSDMNYTIDKIETMTDYDTSFMFASKQVSEVVKGRLTMDGETYNIYCWVGDEDEDEDTIIYTDKYFQTIKTSVEELFRNAETSDMVVSSIEFLGSHITEHMTGKNKHLRDCPLLPFGIHNMEELFSYRKYNNIYSINVKYDLQKLVEAEDIDVVNMLKNIHNADSNSLWININPPAEVDSHFSNIRITMHETSEINVHIVPKLLRVELEDVNIQYSDYAFDILTEKEMDIFDEAKLPDEDKEFLKEMENRDFFRKDYVYKMDIQLIDRFKNDYKLLFKTKKDGCDILYDYREYGYVEIWGNSCINPKLRYSDKYSDCVYVLSHQNFAYDFFNEDGTVKDKVIAYIDIYERTDA